MTPIQASILSNYRIESKNRFVSLNRIESIFFHPNRNALIWMIFVNLHGYHSNEVDVHYGHSDVSKAVNTEAADVMTYDKEFH